MMWAWDRRKYTASREVLQFLDIAKTQNTDRPLRICIKALDSLALSCM